MAEDRNALVKRRGNEVNDLMTKWKPEIQRALPSHMTAERMTRIAMTEFRKNPSLANCEPVTVLAAVIMASQLGLEPGILGQSYLVPYKGTCTLIPGWQGLIDLLSRAGRATAWTGAVYKGDAFEFALGDSPFVKHVPCGNDNPAELTHVYAIGRVHGSPVPVVEVWPIVKVWKHRDRYNKVGDRHYSFAHPEMYARKCPLMQVLKYMPKSVELSQAITLDHAATMGAQALDLPEVIEGTWVPMDVPPDDAPANAEPTATSAAAEKVKAALDKTVGSKTQEPAVPTDTPKPGELV